MEPTIIEQLFIELEAMHPEVWSGILKDNKEKLLKLEKERLISAAEQHRNTRHDAVEKMNEIRARWANTHNFESADNMLNEITGAIFNLKQRTK